jgi:hypothetical protein
LTAHAQSLGLEMAESISELIDTRPDDAQLRQQRNALLRPVGLPVPR